MPKDVYEPIILMITVRVIHAIHGVDGRIGRAGNVGYTSIWCDIIKEMDRMPRSGIKSEQWDHLLDSLEGVMLNPSKDRWLWDLNGSGEFSVASARRGRWQYQQRVDGFSFITHRIESSAGMLHSGLADDSGL
uniref:RNA-directed DNA polymerase, eukaryota, reverse transcriptase zinc-binding domain protein n=1 Tax=Tanacetum cinerariifolium TaxID=118510 RepID=A0A6L2KLX7_TANCI|nr:hypothetical protein [Tanacetum cinerariifolium]